MKLHTIPLFVLFVIISLAACSVRSEDSDQGIAQNPDLAQEVVDSAIAVHGGDLYMRSEIAFSFRGKNFTVQMGENSFRYTCKYEVGDKTFVDSYNNRGEFTRLIDGNEVSEVQGRSEAISQVNSVPYFALLPFKLNDPAVVKEYVGEVAIRDQLYNKVKITFQGEGGGKDPDNVFYYWFHKENGTLDYMGYSKYGNRFREAINQRQVGGIIFNDYINYKSDEQNEPDLANYDQLFQEGKLRELSKIIHEDVTVSTN